MQSLTLSNGLRVNLISDPSASRAAALMQLAAGSHHEPVQWPGLAHLLEHMVFAGSVNYRDEQRLMAWGPRQGARLNATTLATSTAWFFDINAPQLEAGLARLCDMLARPLLTQQALRQELAVIDAEYQLLGSHAATRREAAISAAFSAPAALQAFHVGDRAHLGEDMAALQQALTAYHQRYFHAENLTLWLQGPQDISELAQLAERYAAGFAATGSKACRTEALTLQRDRHFALQASEPPRVLFSFPLTAIDRQSLTLFRQFIADRAPGSLPAILSQRGLCDDLQLSQPYRSEKDAVFTIEFVLSHCDQTLCAQVEAHFFSWLQQLHKVTPQQRQHYAGLAAQQFNRLTPSEQLRERAFGFAPLAQPDIDLQPLLAQLSAGSVSRLWIAPQVQAPVRWLQGFALPLTASSWPQCQQITSPDWQFYSGEVSALTPELPAEQCPLAHFDRGHQQAVLMLSPATGARLPLRSGHIMQVSLRAIASQCAHAGGQLSVDWQQGQWVLQLSGSPQVMLSTLDALLTQLSEIPVALQAQGERQWRQQRQQFLSDIAVRALLNQLPLVMAGDEQHLADLPLLAWQAALYGGDADLRQSLSRLLTRWPGEINPLRSAAAAPQPAQSCWPLPGNGQDAAVLLFCPLTEQTAVCLAAWRVMASLFEPRFFQRLRVEKKLGYAVSCRFYTVAGENGLLFAVQSPDCDAPSIHRHICDFIAAMAQITFDAAVVAGQRDILTESLATPPADRLEACRQQWLNQQSYAPALDAAAIALLTPATLRDYCQALHQQRQRWWHLTNKAR